MNHLDRTCVCVLYASEAVLKIGISYHIFNSGTLFLNTCSLGVCVWIIYRLEICPWEIHQVICSFEPPPPPPLVLLFLLLLLLQMMNVSQGMFLYVNPLALKADVSEHGV